MGLLVVSLFTELHKIKFSQAVSPHEYHNWTADCTASARKELIATMGMCGYFGKN